MLPFGIDKVVNYHMDVPLCTTGFAWVMNKATDGITGGERRTRAPKAGDARGGFGLDKNSWVHKLIIK
jgi:hypothetical protein